MTPAQVPGRPPHPPAAGAALPRPTLGFTGFKLKTKFREIAANSHIYWCLWGNPGWTWEGHPQTREEHRLREKRNTVAGLGVWGALQPFCAFAVPPSRSPDPAANTLPSAVLCSWRFLTWNPLASHAFICHISVPTTPLEFMQQLCF